MDWNAVPRFIGRKTRNIMFDPSPLNTILVSWYFRKNSFYNTNNYTKESYFLIIFQHTFE